MAAKRARPAEWCTLRVFGPTLCTPPMVLLSLEAPSALSATKPRVLDQWLINPREGAQRLFVHERVKTELMAWMASTQCSASHLSGVAGLYFAMSDAGAATVLVQGPKGTSAMVSGLSEFARRKHPILQVRELVGRPTQWGRISCIPMALHGEENKAHSGCTWCQTSHEPAVECSGTTCLLLSIDSGKCLVAVIDCLPGEEALLMRRVALSLAPCSAHRDLCLVVHLASAETCATKDYLDWVATLPASCSQIFGHSIPVGLHSSDVFLCESRQRFPGLYPTSAPFVSAPSAPMYSLFDVPLPPPSWTAPREADGDEIQIDTPALPQNSCVVVLGSGAAKPSSLRGLSALHVWLDCERSALLDVGEGTLWQMERAYGAENVKRAIDTLEFVWISHAHLDHHGGLLLLLQMRSRSLTVIAPHSLSRLLAQCVDPSRFSFIHCAEAAKTLPNLFTVRADHCHDSHSIALDWALSDGKQIRLVYSGDTRRSSALHSLKPTSDRRVVLIHEATFEDSFADEAASKAHSTVADAARAALGLSAHVLLLTHQSQRYATGLPKADVAKAARILKNCTVLDAHDLMRVPCSLAWNTAAQ